MAVELYQRKNGLFALACFSIQPRARSVISSSMVSMRFLVSGPVSSIFCLPTRPKRGSTVSSSTSVARQCMTPRTEPSLEGWVLGIVAKLGFFFGIEVVEVAEELIEPVDGGKVFVAVSQMVLAELAGGVAERLQELGDGRILL